MAAYTAGFMTYVTCRLTDKDRDQLRNPKVGNRVWATFYYACVALRKYISLQRGRFRARSLASYKPRSSEDSMGVQSSTNRGKWGQLTFWEKDEGLKSEKLQKISFLCLCYILRAIRAGRCRERRYADHIFIQIYFRMHHFVVKFSKFSSPQAARGHRSP